MQVESVADYLARGGRVQRLEPCESVPLRITVRPAATLLERMATEAGLHFDTASRRTSKCMDCGGFKSMGARSRRCPTCQQQRAAARREASRRWWQELRQDAEAMELRRQQTREYRRRRREEELAKRTLAPCACGAPVTSVFSPRCRDCQKQHRRELARRRQQALRNRKKTREALNAQQRAHYRRRNPLRTCNCGKLVDNNHCQHCYDCQKERRRVAALRRREARRAQEEAAHG